MRLEFTGRGYDVPPLKILSRITGVSFTSRVTRRESSLWASSATSAQSSHTLASEEDGLPFGSP